MGRQSRTETFLRKDVKMLANTPRPVNKNFIRYIERFYAEQQKEQSQKREIIRLGLSFLLPEQPLLTRTKPMGQRKKRWDDPEVLRAFKVRT